MNKIDIFSHDESFLRIDTAGRAELSVWWNNSRLSDGFWRFYVHDAEGAGVVSDGRFIPMQPWMIYLIPPFAELRGRVLSRTPLRQFYIHFEATTLRGSSDFRINTITPSPEMLQRIRNLFQMETLDVESSRSIYTQAILILETLQLLPDEAIREMDQDRRITRICDHLRRHPDLEPDLPALAIRAQMPLRTFQKKFKDQTGVTAYRYWQTMRYNLAAHMLTAGELSIEEICSAIGINDRFHFSRTFKELYGYPPAAYRKSRR